MRAALSPSPAGTLRSRIEFHTWREAVLTAVEASTRYTTVGKPRVRHGADRWVLTYDYRPVVMNGVAS